MNKKTITLITLVLGGAIAFGIGIGVSLSLKDKSNESDSNYTSSNPVVKNEESQSEVPKLETPKEDKTESEVKKDKLIHSNFESKVQSYVSEFRKSKDDIYTFSQNLDSINTKDLNAEDKAQLNNLKLAAKDWSMLTGHYDYVRQYVDPDPNPEQTMKYAKEALDQVNTNNLVATGVMSKSNVDKYTSFLREYIEKKQKGLNKQQTEDENKELDKQHAKLKTIQEKETFYYNRIKDAKQKQMDYINSIKDPKVKQSVQPSFAAAVSESTFLELRYPEDTNLIEACLKKVINE